ncbi:hypothetical protein SEMRO_1690_G291400.1 [Seminavis robusta]|uniref:Uncharacterized protein n=1 Tax=Seminavis robusta TaxID=568900 RepID=A0A9N8HTP3_9STRA|nr:hypothetical protein SEMRO_1690_G291400.1 [Seminavis robusta]|eukprot:Sro1690_g291400.1 n/a (129) ;mRNA; r:18364-18750
MSTAAQLLSSNAHASNPRYWHNPLPWLTPPQMPPRLVPTCANDPPTVVNPMADGNTVDNKSKRRQAVKAQQAAATDPALSLYSHARHHGCTKDIPRHVLGHKNIPESDAELQAPLVKHQLLEPREQMR